MKLRRPHSLIRHDAGAVTPLAAVTLAAGLGFAGLVTDVGVWYVQKRNLQAATDAAALAAANHPTNAAAIAADFIQRNGFPASAIAQVDAGYYCPDIGVAAGLRFSNAPCAIGDQVPSEPNAVRLQTRATGSLIMGRVLGRSAGPGIGATAVSARIDEAGVTVGSGLVSADLPLVNSVLGALVGGSGLQLTAVQYDGLLNSQLNTLTFFDALATRLNLNSGTYSQLLATNVRVTEVLQAGIDALAVQNEVVDVSAAIAGLTHLKSKVTGSPTITLGQLFDLGVWADQPIGAASAPVALNAGLNAYQFGVFNLQLANQKHAAALSATSLGIPGLVSVDLQASAIEPPQSAYFAFGPKGVSVHTAQVRLKLNVSAVGSTINLPLYIEAGQGTATVSDVSCGAEPGSDAQVKVDARPGVLAVYIGTPPASATTNFGTATNFTNVTPATLINVLNLVRVEAKAEARIAPPNPTQLTFVQPPAGWTPPIGQALNTLGVIGRLPTAASSRSSAGWPAEAVTTQAASGLASALDNSLSSNSVETRLCLLGALLCLGNVNIKLSELHSLVAGLDPLIDGLLSSLGVKLGRVEVMVTGVRCGVPVLVA